MAAATFPNAAGAYCERLEQFSREALFKLGSDGQGLEPTTAEAALGLTAGAIAKQALQLALDGFVTLDFTMAADTNTAGVINLTTLGVVSTTASTSRRIDVDVLVSADVDKGLILEQYLVAGAATPVVYRMLQGFTADAAAAANARAVGAGDWSVALLGAAAVLSVSTADIILTLTGITNIDTRWVGKIKVYPKVSHSLIATT